MSSIAWHTDIWSKQRLQKPSVWFLDVSVISSITRVVKLAMFKSSRTRVTELGIPMMCSLLSPPGFLELEGEEIRSRWPISGTGIEAPTSRVKSNKLGRFPSLRTVWGYKYDPGSHISRRRRFVRQYTGSKDTFPVPRRARWASLGDFEAREDMNGIKKFLEEIAL